MSNGKGIQIAPTNVWWQRDLRAYDYIAPVLSCLVVKVTEVHVEGTIFRSRSRPWCIQFFQVWSHVSFILYLNKNAEYKVNNVIYLKYVCKF